MDFATLRQDYAGQTLDEHSIDPNPFIQFRKWFDDAVSASIREPNAMALATAGSRNVPSVRMVLLKGFDESGFVFFTNYESAKAGDLSANPWAELLFFWGDVSRQVRICGTVHQVSRQESEEYFRSRPYEARIGALASNQSRPLASRAELEQRISELKARYPDGTEVPLPAHWGGYRLTPIRFEFWQGRLSRIHDRVEYSKDPKGEWSKVRLSP